MKRYEIYDNLIVIVKGGIVLMIADIEHIENFYMEKVYHSHKNPDFIYPRLNYWIYLSLKSKSKFKGYNLYILNTIWKRKAFIQKTFNNIDYEYFKKD